MPSPSYHAKRFNLEGLTGISDHALKLHFKPYEGYVQEANRLTDRIGSCHRDGQVSQDEMSIFSELTRRLGYEYIGVVLHEYHFDNLKWEAEHPQPSSAFMKAAEPS